MTEATGAVISCWRNLEPAETADDPLPAATLDALAARVSRCLLCDAEPTIIAQWQPTRTVVRAAIERRSGKPPGPRSAPLLIIGLCAQHAAEAERATRGAENALIIEDARP